MDKIFPTKLPYADEVNAYIPLDTKYNICSAGDFIFLLVHALDEAKTKPNVKRENIEAIESQQSRSTIWRRKKRLQKLGITI